jgi:glycosyltransferase involved in cell wall biosynthesis
VARFTAPTISHIKESQIPPLPHYPQSISETIWHSATGTLNIDTPLTSFGMTANPTHHQLSLCMIVKNEAQNLGRCLASAQAWVDEMIVVDTGSGDETVSIAKSFGANVDYFEWCNDFASARNYSLSLATGEWILVLDADEELFPQPGYTDDWRTTPDLLAWQINLWDADAREGLTSMATLRLFRNHPDLVYVGRYHEALLYQGQPIPTEQTQPLTSLGIRHYGYSQAALHEKSPSRIAHLEQLRQQEGLSLMLLWTLSGFYELTEQPDPVANCYAEAWERLLPNLLSGEKPSDTRAIPSWLYSLGVRAIQQEDLEAAPLIAQTGLKWFPDYPPFYYLNGLLVRLLGFSLGATPYLKACLHLGQTGSYLKSEPFDQNLITVLPAYDLGCIALEQKQFTEAVAYFEQVLSYQPDHTSAQTLLEQAKQHR